MAFFGESRFSPKPYYSATTSGPSVLISLQQIYSVAKELFSKLDELSLELLKSSSPSMSCQNCKNQQKRCHTLRVLLAKKQYSINQLENKLKKNSMKRKYLRHNNSNLAKMQQRNVHRNIYSEPVRSLQFSDKRKVSKTMYSADSFCQKVDSGNGYDVQDIQSSDNSQESIVYSQNSMDQYSYADIFEFGLGNNASKPTADTAAGKSPEDQNTTYVEDNADDLTLAHKENVDRYPSIDQQTELERNNPVITPVKHFHKQGVNTCSESKPFLKSSSSDVQHSLKDTALCCTSVAVSDKELGLPALPLVEVVSTVSKAKSDGNISSCIINIPAVSHSQSKALLPLDKSVNQPENNAGKISTDLVSMSEMNAVNASPVEMELVEAEDVIVIDDDEDDLNMLSPDSHPPSPSLLTSVPSESDLDFLDTSADADLIAGEVLPKVTNKNDCTTTNTTIKKVSDRFFSQGSNAKIHSRSFNSQQQNDHISSSSDRTHPRKRVHTQNEKYTKPLTPEGFWDIGFPDSDSEKRKAKDDSEIVHLPRLRKPYIKKFNSLTEDLEQKKTEAEKK